MIWKECIPSSTQCVSILRAPPPGATRGWCFGMILAILPGFTLRETMLLDFTSPKSCLRRFTIGQSVLWLFGCVEVLCVLEREVSLSTLLALRCVRTLLLRLPVEVSDAVLRESIYHDMSTMSKWSGLETSEIPGCWRGRSALCKYIVHCLDRLSCLRASQQLVVRGTAGTATRTDRDRATWCAEPHER